MSKLKLHLSNDKGSSLIEVMIALFMTGLITAAALSLYSTQHESYLVQDDVTTIQQSSRASLDEITKHIRMAGNRVPAGLPAIVAYNTNPDTIIVTYSSSDCQTWLSSKMPQPSAELKCGSDVSCFYDDQWVYIFDPDSGGGEFFLITHVQEAAKHLQHNTMTLSRKYDEDAIILALNQYKFYIDNTTDPDHPILMFQEGNKTPQPYADDITDLQFQYRMTNGVIEDEPILVDNIREVMISLTGKGNLQVLSDGAQGGNGDTDDNYRERTYSTSVHVRNLAM